MEITTQISGKKRATAIQNIREKIDLNLDGLSVVDIHVDRTPDADDHRAKAKRHNAVSPSKCWLRLPRRLRGHSRQQREGCPVETHVVHFKSTAGSVSESGL